MRKNKLWKKGLVLALSAGMFCSPLSTKAADYIEKAEIGREALGLTEAEVDSSFSEWQSPLIGTKPGTYKAVEAQSAVVVGSNLVNVRSDAGTSYEKVAQLVRYQPVTILGEKTASNGIAWYKIGFTLNGTYKEGYMHSSYLMMTTALTEGDSSDTTFEERISSFPESYKTILRSLHKMFPNWQFEPVHTGLSWDEVVAEEYVLTRNLVPDSSAFSWKSVRDGDYNWSSDTWIYHDSGWVGASKEAIAYYLDPRNFMTADCRITQFETHTYEEGVQDKTGLEAILKDSFMGKEGDKDRYYDAFLKAGKEANVSPYILASRCLQEVGREGSATTSGTYPGYEGYYNFFNIGASANADGTGAVENALKYAKEKGWDTEEKSIVGGAMIIGANYIAKGQNTFYFQKFNVVNTESGLYSHQYMQNLSAASTEGASLQKTYADWQNAAIVYRIPVCENMPEEAAPLPTGVTNNYNLLSKLLINGKEAEGFDGEKTSYEITVKNGLLGISGSCPMSGASVSLPETVILTTGTFEKEVVVTAPDGSKRSYLLHITAEEGSKGDADGNGSITAEDALAVLKNVVGICNQEGNGTSVLDVDGNETVTAEDALMILKYVVGIIDNFS